MRHILHLIKDPTNPAALDVVTRQAADPDVAVSVVLLQAVADLPNPLAGPVYRLAEGHGAAGLIHPLITHTQLLDLIFAADTVIGW